MTCGRRAFKVLGSLGRLDGSIVGPNRGSWAGLYSLVVGPRKGYQIKSGGLKKDNGLRPKGPRLWNLYLKSRTGPIEVQGLSEAEVQIIYFSGMVFGRALEYNNCD